MSEWAYNLHDGAARYSHDEKIGMFSAILNNEVRIYMIRVRMFEAVISVLLLILHYCIKRQTIIILLIHIKITHHLRIIHHLIKSLIIMELLII